LLWALTVPGLQITCPLSIWSFSTPLRSNPTFIPASAESNCLWNISTPVTTVFFGSAPRPRISTSSFILMIPLSILPVATVPLPLIENTSSTGIKNGFSLSLTGTGMYVSKAFNKSQTGLAAPSASVAFSAALRAEPLMIGVFAPSYPCLVNKSLISSSTKSNMSASATISHLFKKTTIFGTLTCLAKRTCSLVWGIGPSVPATTRIAPSIWAAPTIMFLI